MEAPERATEVAIVIVKRGTKFLVRIRPPGGPMPGVHEFAGGKCEPGESPEETARREAFEEIGMHVSILGLRASFEHRYPHGLIHLSYFDAEPSPPDAEPAASSGFRWVDVSELSTLTFPPANESVIAQLVQEAASQRGQKPGPPCSSP
jgi:8-oxo-dGTP diphosphatase